MPGLTGRQGGARLGEGSAHGETAMPRGVNDRNAIMQLRFSLKEMTGGRAAKNSKLSRVRLKGDAWNELRASW